MVDPAQASGRVVHWHSAVQILLTVLAGDLNIEYIYTALKAQRHSAVHVLLAVLAGYLNKEYMCTALFIVYRHFAVQVLLAVLVGNLSI